MQPPINTTSKWTGRVRFVIGRFNRINIEIEMKKTHRRGLSEAWNGGTEWIKCPNTKEFNNELVRKNVFIEESRVTSEPVD